MFCILYSSPYLDLIKKIFDFFSSQATVRTFFRLCSLGVSLKYFSAFGRVISSHRRLINLQYNFYGKYSDFFQIIHKSEINMSLAHLI